MSRSHYCGGCGLPLEISEKACSGCGAEVAICEKQTPHGRCARPAGHAGSHTHIPKTDDWGDAALSPDVRDAMREAMPDG